MRFVTASLAFLVLVASACRHVDDSPVVEGGVAPEPPGPTLACGRSEEVPGPDGKAAVVVSCASSADAFKRADQECPDGYVVRTSAAIRERWQSTWQLVVSCKAPAAPAREDAQVCEAAYPHAKDFATYWAARSSAKRLDELPSQHDFVVTCHGLPERVQRCMHELYRQAHAAPCEAVLSRLDPPTQAQIDGLFLAAVTQAPPAAAAKGSSGQ
jgi:hypothetical protein